MWYRQHLLLTLFSDLPESIFRISRVTGSDVTFRPELDALAGFHSRCLQLTLRRGNTTSLKLNEPIACQSARCIVWSSRITLFKIPKFRRVLLPTNIDRRCSSPVLFFDIYSTSFGHKKVLSECEVNCCVVLQRHN